MIKKAREIDPTKGYYRLLKDGKLDTLKKNVFYLILCAFTFDNIPHMEKKVNLFRGLSNLLNTEGKIVNLVLSPEIYTHEWSSFSTKDFPENKSARSGDKVRIIITDIEDKRPVEDVIFSDKDYREVFERAGLDVVNIYKPLAKKEEPYQWINETKIAPWVIYVLKKVY